jgi:hypothetical protein
MSGNREENVMKVKRTAAVEAAETPEQIRARGEARVRTLGIVFVGLTTVFLTLSGVASLFITPDRAKDVWLTVGPILTAAISGMLGFWAGTRRRRA